MEGSMQEEYEKALKTGMKYYKSCVAKDENPYLAVLDDILSRTKTENWISAGTMDVPAEWVIGTKTAGRSHDFAGNFMPIADPGSEFCDKWKRLCQAHLDEGIHDAVIAYEYMNRYYVQEGNKRVSVLKYFDAVSIPAQVRRILPERSDDPAVKAYYEFLDFGKRTNISFIEFSEASAYRKFQKLMGKDETDAWEEDEIRRLHRVYYTFTCAYKETPGSGSQNPAGDAFLSFLEIYGPADLFEMTQAQMKKNLLKAREEIKLQQETDKIQVETEAKASKSNILQRVFRKRKLKCAFLLAAAPAESEWVMGHEVGRLSLKEKFSGNVETASFILNGQQDAEKILDEIIKSGYDVVFATSPEMIRLCLKPAVEHPEIIFMVCALNKPHRAIRAYYPRMYGVKFVIGAIAGALCENHKIGYICRYPIYGSIAEINAFARGVQMTDPKAKVYLEWSGEQGMKKATDILRDKGISLISVRDHVKRENCEMMLYGLTRIDDETYTPLAAPVWKWDVYYEKIIGSIMDGTFRNEEEKTPKSLNYYWGVATGVVDIVCSGKIPKGVRYLAETLMQGISMNICHPFYNPEETEDGKVIWNTKDRALGMDEVLNMDWLESNIEGSIPRYDELDEKTRQLVDVMGTTSARKGGSGAEEKKS